MADSWGFVWHEFLLAAASGFVPGSIDNVVSTLPGLLGPFVIWLSVAFGLLVVWALLTVTLAIFDGFVTDRGMR
jgi:hypothetical protein